MAAKSTSIKKFREQLTCSVCNKLFTEPKTLPCMHTYCGTDCLNQLSRWYQEKKRETSTDNTEDANSGSVDEPSSEIESNIEQFNNYLCVVHQCKESKDPEKVVTNHSFMNQIQFLKLEDKITSNEDTKCDDCTEGNVATAFCKECKHALCKICETAHRRSVRTNDHNIKPFEEIRSSGDSKSVATRNTWKCDVHKDTSQDTNLSMYCIECGVLICLYCSVSEPHCNHKGKQIAKNLLFEPRDDEPKIMEQIRQKIDAAQEVEEEFKTSIQGIENMMKSLKESHETTAAAVNQRCTEIVEEITRQRDELLANAKLIFERKETILKDQLAELKKIKKTLREASSFANEILEVSIPEEVLFLRGVIENNLQELHDTYNSQTYNHTPHNNDIINFCQNTEFTMRQAIGIVSADFHDVEVDNLSDLQMIENQEDELLLSYKDIIGNVVEGNTHDVAALMWPKDSEDEKLRGVVTKPTKSGEKYRVKLTPKKAGKHILEIQLSKEVKKHTKRIEVKVLSAPKLSGPAVEAIEDRNLGNPWGIAISREGVIVVTDIKNHRVVVFDASKIYMRHIGEEGKGNLQFKSPRGIAFGPKDGQVVVVDKENHRFQIFTLESQFIKEVGAFGGDRFQFNHPTGVVINREGIIFVTDSVNQRVQFFSPEGDGLGVFGEWGDSLGYLNEPYAIAIDVKGRLLIAEREGCRVQLFQKVERDGDLAFEAVKVVWNRKEEKPVGIACDVCSKYLFLTRSEKHAISILSSSGRCIISHGTQGKGMDQFLNPMGVAVMKDHKVVVADCANSRLLVFQYLNEEDMTESYCLV